MEQWVWNVEIKGFYYHPDGRCLPTLTVDLLDGQAPIEFARLVDGKFAYKKDPAPDGSIDRFNGPFYAMYGNVRDRFAKELLERQGIYHEPLCLHSKTKEVLLAEQLGAQLDLVTYDPVKHQDTSFREDYFHSYMNHHAVVFLVVGIIVCIIDPSKWLFFLHCMPLFFAIMLIFNCLAWHDSNRSDAAAEASGNGNRNNNDNMHED